MSGRSHTPVTVLGLGLMGSAIAKAFLAAGHPTTVWNRTAAKADALVGLGAENAPSVAAAIAAAPLVVVSLLDDAAVEAALDAAGPALRGRVLVNLTSSSPEQSRMRAEWATRRGAEYVDGAVMAVPQGIGTPDALLLYSGSETGYRTAEPALQALSAQGIHLGADYGRAAAFDAALVSVFWLSLFGVSLGLALAGAEGIQGSELVPFTPAVLALLPAMMAQTAAQVEAGHYPADDTSISSAYEAFTTLRAVIARHGIDTGVLDASGDVFRRALEAGYGADGLARLVPILAGGR
ncbi:NAD(P)-dependent oxidoreductase [Nocardia jinanensis]|uniref:3-hydroxyisobutyrate dehydrogenase n=1 Tax=Nocardia jinanensis TaxID=382504 RepID=A0A917VQ39_9NOCA|nr:NAD(P)-binding domain-containing protein [Nocardia jinanensis]GGL02945.1 3-hydroxyisobutyrate dehydrogenase [Nocardia jinanensis]